MPEETGLSFQWHRASVGRGWTHPVKRRDVEALLAQVPDGKIRDVWLAGRDFVTSATHFRATQLQTPSDIDPDDFLILASGRWQGLDENQGQPAMMASISIYPVPMSERAAARDLLLGEAFPALIRWLTDIQCGPETGRTERRRIALYRQLDQVRQAEG